MPVEITRYIRQMGDRMSRRRERFGPVSVPTDTARPGTSSSRDVVPYVGNRNRSRSPHKVSDAIKAIVTCKCCYRVRPNWYICRGGHSTCAECSLELRACPQCRRRIITDTPVFDLNDIAKLYLVKCSRESEGCLEMFEPEELVEHSTQDCVFRKISCHLSKECGQISVNDFGKHLHDHHNVRCIDLGQNLSSMFTFKVDKEADFKKFNLMGGKMLKWKEHIFLFSSFFYKEQLNMNVYLVGPQTKLTKAACYIDIGDGTFQGREYRHKIRMIDEACVYTSENKNLPRDSISLASLIDISQDLDDTSFSYKVKVKFATRTY